MVGKMNVIILATELKNICKWYKKPSVKLLWQKYVWGNRQKIFLWNLKNKAKERKKYD